MTKNLLSIAGFDPSGGAGILLDVRLFERLGFRGCGVLTAVTAQNPARVTEAARLPASLVLRQYGAFGRSLRFEGIKVGMIGSLENVKAVAHIPEKNNGIPRVIDPVFKSSSGFRLLDERAVTLFLRVFKAKAELITPNLEEASTLSRRPVETVEDMKEAGRVIYESSLIPCLVKGGHLKGKAADILYDGRDFTTFEHLRLNKSVHGTGCFLSSAILACLAGGSDLKTACRHGIRMTGRAIAEALPAGHGRSVFAL